MDVLEMDFERIFEAPLFLSNSHSITQCYINVDHKVIFAFPVKNGPLHHEDFSQECQ